MFRICDVKECKEPANYNVKVGPLDVSVCGDHHETVFELGRRFNDEYNNMTRRYFEWVLNLKTGG